MCVIYLFTRTDADRPRHNTQPHKQTDAQSHRQTITQTDRQTDAQSHRQTEAQTKNRHVP